MKVLMINTSDSSGGAAIACLRLQSALQKFELAQSQVLVQEKKKISPDIQSISKGAWGEKRTWLRFVGERLAFLPYEKSKSIRFLFNRGVIGTDISKHPLVQEADVLHLHWINFGFLSVAGIGELLKLGKPVVWTFHDMWSFTGGCHHSGDCDHYLFECGSCKFLARPSADDISHSGWLSKKRAYVPQAFTAVGCSQWLSRRAQQSSLLQNFRIESIPNPIDIAVFRPLAKQAARKHFNLPQDKELILFAAMRVGAPGKGFSILVEALKYFVQQFPELSQQVELVVFGQAEESTLADLPLRTHQLGHLTETEKIVMAYNASSMFVTPSLEENLPNTIMEAFACGLPAIGFEVGGIPEMIDHLVNGFVAQYRSATSIAEGIKWVLDHNQEGLLSAKSRQKAMTHYAEEVVARQYFKLYQSLL